MRPINPYAVAAGIAAVKNAPKVPPRTQVANPVPARTQEFFDALCINHGGNRAKVSTALAHRMTTDEVKDAIHRLHKERTDKANKLAALNAPECILINCRKEDQPAINLLNRVLKSRGLDPVTL